MFINEIKLLKAKKNEIRNGFQATIWLESTLELFDCEENAHCSELYSTILFIAEIQSKQINQFFVFITVANPNLT
jgi:hypothetical protein